jgi:hypothetical protein
MGGKTLLIPSDLINLIILHGGSFKRICSKSQFDRIRTYVEDLDGEIRNTYILPMSNKCQYENLKGVLCFDSLRKAFRHMFPAKVLGNSRFRFRPEKSSMA